jgi:hypothetical protein
MREVDPVPQGSVEQHLARRRPEFVPVDADAVPLFSDALAGI